MAQVNVTHRDTVCVQVTIEPVAKQETNEDTGLAGALARALMARQKNMTGGEIFAENIVATTCA